MSLPILEIDYLLIQLANLLFGHYNLVSIFIILFIILTCMANNIDLKLGIIVAIPALVGLIGYGWIPNIFWVFPILISASLWMVVAMIMLNIPKK